MEKKGGEGENDVFRRNTRKVAVEVDRKRPRKNQWSQSNTDENHNRNSPSFITSHPERSKDFLPWAETKEAAARATIMKKATFMIVEANCFGKRVDFGYGRRRLKC